MAADLSKDAPQATDRQMAMAICANDLAAAAKLLAEGFDPSARIDSGSHCDTPASLACQHGREDILAMLIEAGADPDGATTTGGRPPLSVAIDFHQHVCAMLLVEAGCDLNLRDKLGDAPMHIATRNGDCATLALLIRAGADIDALDEPVPDGLPSNPDNDGTAFDPDGSSWTPAMFAIYYDSPQCLDLLIKAGADLAHRDVEGKSAMDLALEISAFDFSGTSPARICADLILAELHRRERATLDAAAAPARKPPAPGRRI